MQSLIAPEIRPVVKHAAHLSRRGCKDPSEAFSNFSFTQLSNASVLPINLTLENFSPCEYLPHLQQVLFSTDEMDESVTYETFVVIPDQLNNSLYELFGSEAVINGRFVSFYVAARAHHVSQMPTNIFSLLHSKDIEKLRSHVSSPLHYFCR